MMLRVLALLVLLPSAAAAATAADLARAIRENTFDRDECYRVRDITLVKDDIRLYMTDGHLIFSKPVGGRRTAAVFTADVEGGDGEIIVLPPDRAERSSLARYIDSPNLDEHFRAALFLFTGDEYERIREQLGNNPANKKTPELGALLDQEWSPVLQNLGASYQTRLTLDLLDGPGHPTGLFAAMFNGLRLGNFDIIYDPDAPEQVFAGRLVTRENQLFFDTWMSFQSRSRRSRPQPPVETLALNNYRIEATVSPDLSMNVVARVKVKPAVDSMTTATFDLNPQMEISAVTVDGRPAEWLQRESLRLNLTRGGNGMFLVMPAEPLRAGREYEFEFRYSGRVIHDAGDRVYYVSARGNWYPTHGLRFADYDLTFRNPADLEMVGPGDVVEDRVEGDMRITRRRTSAPIRMAGFNLGNYEHARAERGPYVVDVCANRALEKALQPRPPMNVVPPLLPPAGRSRRSPADLTTESAPPPPNPLERLQVLATEVASAMEFMSSRFGPPALPHLTVSPIPGTFGQGFPGLLYLSTLSYLKHLPRAVSSAGETQELFFADLLQAHETAHQWWGNRVAATAYRDYWLMEALANYSALLYVEKSRGAKYSELMLDSYRTSLLQKNEAGQIVDSTGPIVLGPRLETSQEPRAWRNITYGKGTWILHMLRGRMGDERFFSMLADLLKRYDRQSISTEQFRLLASTFMPAKSDDPKLEAFFGQWVYATGIPGLKLSWSLKGKAPALRLVGTIAQSEVDEDFTALVPVEIQAARGRTITQWVRTGNSPTTFTVPLATPPLKVALDPHRAVLRR
jgi:Peptidase family M1 domain